MNKLYASLLVVGLGISAFGATSTPIETTDKQSIPFPAYAGVKTCIISNSTGTNAVECTPNAASSATPTTAPISGIILQVIGSSLSASTDFLTFRDSSTANTSSAVLFAYSQGSAQTPVGGIIYPRFKNGLSVNANVAPPATTGFWTIVYTTDIY